VLLIIFSTRLESSSSMEKTLLAEATTGGGRELEKRYGLIEIRCRMITNCTVLSIKKAR
jgi:hypothetical protein